MSRWKAKLLDDIKSQPQDFVELNILSQQPDIPQNSMTLIINDKYKLIIYDDFDPDVLKRVLQVTGEVN